MTPIVPGEAHLQALATEWHGAYHPGRRRRGVEKSVQVQHEQVTVSLGRGLPVGSQVVMDGKAAPPRLPFAPLCKGLKPCRRENVSVRQLCELVEKTINAIERDHGIAISLLVIAASPLHFSRQLAAIPPDILPLQALH